MKSIFFIALLAIVSITGCKKTLLQQNDVQEKDRQQKAGTMAVIGCNGNTWQQQGQVFEDYSFTMVYNNKYYQFLQNSNKIRIYDGISWDSIFTQMPFVENGYEYGGPQVNYKFTIGDKGYFGYCGDPKTITYDNFLYQYNFLTNTWQNKTKFPGTPRRGVSFFSIGNKGYLAGGDYSYGTILKETWEYNAVNDSWTQKVDLPVPHADATAFTIGNNGFIVNGYKYSGTIPQYLKTLYRYNPTTNTWYDQATFPGDARAGSEVFVINGLAYAGGGYNKDRANATIFLKDFYVYNPQSYTWKKVADFPLTDKLKWDEFSINSRGYVIYKTNSYNSQKNMYKYTPLSCNNGGTSP